MQPNSTTLVKKKVENKRIDYESPLKGTLKIKEFYRGKHILITGCTGFMAKVMVEKLIRSIPDVGKFYLLVRPKKNVKAMDRIKEILDAELFDELRRRMGHRQLNAYIMEKIVPIYGDLTEENLGLSAEDRALLVENINVIYNFAASTNFNSPLKKALNINYFGTVRLLDLAKQCKDLAVYAHISTCGTQMNQPSGNIIDEEINWNYGPKDVGEFVSKIMSMSDEDVAEQQNEFVGNWQNTYLLTKNLVEKYLHKHKDDIKVVIHRPSYVTPTIAEPFPGWIEGVFAGGILLII